MPRQSTKPVQSATTIVTAGERSDFTRRALSAASTVARLTSSRRDSSSSCRPKAFTTRIDSSPCSTTATMSLWWCRTSCVARLTTRLSRATNSSKNGVTPTAMSAKSNSSQSMRPSMPMMVSRSTRMSSVDDDAKPWMVSMSSVMVDSSAPVWWLS